MKYILYIATFFLFFSCQKKTKNEIQKVLTNSIGKEIVFPENIINDSVFPKRSDYKIIFYVDSIGCFSCKLDFRKWRDLITDFDQIKDKRVDFLFILQTSKTEKLEYLMKWDEFDYPIYFDEHNSFYTLNKLPGNAIFHTFLLDNENKIIAMGDPVSNLEIKKLYLKIIQGKGIMDKIETEALSKTYIEVEKSILSLGTFDWENEQSATFNLKNVGQNPLVIEDILTSCGCTIVEYPKEPTRPNKILNLKVRYKAEYPEHFNKTITVYCNVKDSPFQLKISGDAKLGYKESSDK